MGKRAKLNILLIDSQRTVRSWNDAIKTGRMLKDAKGEGKAAEQREYARAIEGEDSFIELILTANDTIARPAESTSYVNFEEERKQ